MAEHECKRQPYCCCYMLADAPSDDCPIHGGGNDNRCGVCGRFMRVKELGHVEQQANGTSDGDVDDLGPAHSGQGHV